MTASEEKQHLVLALKRLVRDLRPIRPTVDALETKLRSREYEQQLEEEKKEEIKECSVQHCGFHALNFIHCFHSSSDISDPHLNLNHFEASQRNSRNMSSCYVDPDH